MNRKQWLGVHATPGIEPKEEELLNDALDAAGDLLDALEELEAPMTLLSRSIESLSQTIATLRSQHQASSSKEWNS